MSRPSSSVLAPSGFVGRFFIAVERWSSSVAEHAGQLGILAWNIGVACVRLRVSKRDIVRQLHIIGIQSIMIVLIAAALIGVVTSQQGGYQMQSQIPLYVMGSVVSRASFSRWGRSSRPS